MKLAVLPSRIGILGVCALLAGLVLTGPLRPNQLGGGLAMADPKDPTLTALFAGLAAATSSSEAAPIEQRIWQLWIHADDDEVNRTMASGIHAMGIGDGAAALEAFNKAVAAKPDFAEAWNKRATLYYLLHRYPESVAPALERVSVIVQIWM